MDLLTCFAPEAPNDGHPNGLIAQISRRLVAGQPPDVLHSWLRSSNPDHDYLQALHELEAATRAQRQLVSSLGWELVPVPSLPDLKHSLNYLNGVQGRTRCLLPVNGGFHADLD